MKSQRLNEWNPEKVENLASITEPPCRGCEYWQPERDLDGELVLCHANKYMGMQDDFSCFAPRGKELEEEELAMESLRRKAPVKPKKSSSTQIANRWGISLLQTKRVIMILSCNGKIPNLARAIFDTDIYHEDMIIKNYLYGPKEVEIIENELCAMGYTPKT